MCDLDDRDKINTGANLVFARAFLYNKRKDNAKIRFAGGVYEEKGSNWTTKF